MSLAMRIAAAYRAFALKDSSQGMTSLDLFRELYGRAPAQSGKSVTVNTALQAATVFSCLRVIGEGIGQSPCDLFRDRADRGKDPAKDHPLYTLFALAPNELQTPFGFFETLVFHAGLTGDFIALKSMVRARVDELLPIEPGMRRWQRGQDGLLRYFVRLPGGSEREIDPRLIWHVRGPSWNGREGLDILKVAREAIGLALAIEGDQAKLYANGLRSSGTYSIEGTLDKTEYETLRDFIKAQQAEQGGPLILDRAAKYLQQTMTGVDAQTLESRKHQVEEICRLFRVMPIMIGHGGDQSPTFASAEQFFIAHVVHTLLPWCRRIEMAINKDLIGRDDFEAGVKAKFNLDALMRGSFKDRQDAFAKMLGAGGSTPYAEVNEVRELDDMNPVDWGNGKPQMQQKPSPQVDPQGTMP